MKLSQSYVDKQERLTKLKEFKSLMCPIGCDHTLRLSFNVSRVINSTLSCFPVQSPLPTGCVSDFNCVRREPLRLDAMRHRHTSDFSSFFFGIYRLFHNSGKHQRNECNCSKQWWAEVNQAEGFWEPPAFLCVFVVAEVEPSTEHSDKSQTYPHRQGSTAGMLLSSNLFQTIFATCNSAPIWSH